MSSRASGGLPTRIFGKTGERVPVLGLGTGEGGMGLSERKAVRLFRKAIDAGITYVDTAPGYGLAQERLSRVLEKRRDEVFLVTKVPTSNGEAFTEGLEMNLTILKTDRVDLAFIHSVGEQNIDELLSPGGSLEALLKAKERGLTRFVGFTAHNKPGNALRILDACGDLDAVMLAMNFVERHVYGFEDRVLPRAREMNLGVAAMKVYGGTTGMQYHKPFPSAMKGRGDFDHRLAFRYGLGLPGVALNVIGVFSEKELERNIEWAKTFEAPDQTECAEMEEAGRKAAQEWGPRYGPVE